MRRILNWYGNPIPFGLFFCWVTSCTRWANTTQMFSFLQSRLFSFLWNLEKNDLPILLALNILSLNLSDHHDDESGHIFPSLDVYNLYIILVIGKIAGKMLG